MVYFVIHKIREYISLKKLYKKYNLYFNMNRTTKNNSTI